MKKILVAIVLAGSTMIGSAEAHQAPTTARGCHFAFDAEGKQDDRMHCHRQRPAFFLHFDGYKVQGVYPSMAVCEKDQAVHKDKSSFCSKYSR